jgi:hypothetical protein
MKDKRHVTYRSFYHSGRRYVRLPAALATFCLCFSVAGGSPCTSLRSLNTPLTTLTQATGFQPQK